MQAAGCDVLITVAIPKFGALAIRKVAEIDWKPLHILNGIASSVGATLKPAGLENAKGIISDTSFKDPTDPQWLNDAGYKQWLAFMDKYYPNGDKTDNQTVYGYSIAETTVQVLKQCGDDLTRENVMKQAANLHESRTADVAAWHRDQHQPHRLRADQASPDEALQRHKVPPWPCAAFALPPGKFFSRKPAGITVALHR